MLACNCLNVILETKSDDLPKVNRDTLRLDEHEAKDVFFKQELVQASSLGNVSKAHSSLINVRDVGSWLVCECLNCGFQTHAVQREDGGPVLLHSKLLKTPAIIELKKNILFSSVYNIVVYANLEDAKQYDYFAAEVEQSVADFRRRAKDVINKEEAAVAEKVRVYAEQQYAMLEEYREHVLKEQEALTRVVLKNKMNNKLGSTNMETSVSKPVAAKVPEDSTISTKPIEVKAQQRLVTQEFQSPEKRNNYKSISQHNSFDAECLFDLEGMDDIDPYLNEEEELSDHEEIERDDGIQIKSNKINQQMNLAKSLPMTIPGFMSTYQSHEIDDQEDMLQHPEMQMDIAASIKALAKSAHGDTVFGDLPRPRCRTNI